MGYLKSIGTFFIYVGSFLALITFLPGLPPNAQFSEYTILPPQQSLTSHLKANNRLDDVEILFKGELKGPESFASYNGELYTGLHGGDVVKIVGKHIVPIVKFGKPCDGVWMEKECGRPLGLEFDKKGALYVIDTYYGLYKVDVTSGKYEKIIDNSVPIDGVEPKFMNSLDIAANGDIYWTDSSSEFHLEDGVYTFFTNPVGRLIKYDAATKRNTVLVDNLGFANGVKLSKDESFVVVAESMAGRLTKYHIKGPKAGGAEPFVQGLPGLPDNIHSDGEDGFLVSLIADIDADHPSISHMLAPHPYIRRMLTRLIYLLEAPFKLIEDVYPNYYSKRITHWIGHFESTRFLHSETITILRISADGKVVDAARGSNGKVSGISSAFIFKDHLYLGSPYNEYLARVPVDRAFSSIKTSAKKVVKREVKETIQPSETTKPDVPTTTTKPLTTAPKQAATPPEQPVTTTPPPPSQQKQQPPPQKQPPQQQQQKQQPPPQQQKQQQQQQPPQQQQQKQQQPPQQQQQKQEQQQQKQQQPPPQQQQKQQQPPPQQQQQKQQQPPPQQQQQKQQQPSPQQQQQKQQQPPPQQQQQKQQQPPPQQQQQKQQQPPPQQQQQKQQQPPPQQQQQQQQQKQQQPQQQQQKQQQPPPQQQQQKQQQPPPQQQQQKQQQPPPQQQQQQQQQKQQQPQQQQQPPKRQ